MREKRGKRMVSCIKLGSSEFAANYIYNAHSHRHIEIDYVLTGHCMITTDNGNVPLSGGECVVIASGTRHGFLVENSGKCRIRQFEFDGVSEEEQAVEMLSGKVCPCYKLTYCEEIGEALKQLYRYYEENDAYAEELFSLEFRKLLLLLLRYRDETEKKKQYRYSELVENVIHVLDEDYLQEISLEELARKQYVSSSYLRRVFVREVGFSAMEYITVLRMERAKRLLKDSEKTISEVAASTGYSNLQHFSSQFKKKIGISPTDFRMQIKTREG